MPECIHEIELASCGVCRPRPSESPVIRPERSWGPWFTARFDGHCAGCDDPVGPGDLIRSDGSGGWLCTDCGHVSYSPRIVRVTGDLL
jgi:hypothetical protein